jgi:hypothetical protein
VYFYVKNTNPKPLFFFFSFFSLLQNSLWTGLGGDIDKGLWGVSVLLPSAEDTCKFAAGTRPEATSVCGLKLLVYAALSYSCMRP